jgi:uncharacterized protein (DUF1800 family)
MPISPTPSWTARILVLLGAGIGSAYAPSIEARADPQAALFADSFESFAPQVEIGEASRFLQQATFGATPEEIHRVRRLGLEAWIDQQVAEPATLSRPFLEALAVERRTAPAAPRTINQEDRLHRWVDTAVRAPDQLRQKMAHALSQIVVVSDRADSLFNEPLMMAEWNDLLVRNALGNYRTLLQEATRSPMMARYLTFLRNRKFDLEPICLRPQGGGEINCDSLDAPPYTIVRYVIPNNGSQPDENYAREVMQLFSIGLVDRDPDFSPVLLGGEPIPTYDQQTVTTLARALTGLSYDCSGDAEVGGVPIPRDCGAGCIGADCRFTNARTLFFDDPPRATVPNSTLVSSVIHPDFLRPLVCYPRYHDNGRDLRRFELPGPGGSNPIANTTLLDANAVPAGTPPDAKVLSLSGTVVETLLEQSPDQSKEQVADCNASGPAALSSLDASQRAACVAHCEDDVTRAIDALFDHPNTAPMVSRMLIQRLTTSNPSPQYVERVSLVFEDNGAGVRGDLRAVTEAILLDAEARLPPADERFADSGKPREPLLKLLALWRAFGAVSADGWRWGLRTPETAFLQRPLGAPSVFNFFEPDYRQPGAIADAELYSPEFQVINENSALLSANEMLVRICIGYDNCGSPFAQPSGDRAYFPPQQLDALPQDDVALIEELDLRLMGGLMSGEISDPSSCSANSGMKGTLYKLLHCGLAGTLGDSSQNADVNARRRKVLYLLHLIAISPEFIHQR